MRRWSSRTNARFQMTRIEASNGLSQHWSRSCAAGVRHPVRAPDQARPARDPATFRVARREMRSTASWATPAQPDRDPSPPSPASRCTSRRRTARTCSSRGVTQTLGPSLSSPNASGPLAARVRAVPGRRAHPCRQPPPARGAPPHGSLASPGPHLAGPGAERGVSAARLEAVAALGADRADQPAGETWGRGVDPGAVGPAAAVRGVRHGRGRTPDAHDVTAPASHARGVEAIVHSAGLRSRASSPSAPPALAALNLRGNDGSPSLGA